MRKKIIFISSLMFFMSCAGPKVTYVPKMETSHFPQVEPSKVVVFETIPGKGSFLEVGEIFIEDEIKCSPTDPSLEQKSLEVVGRLRKEHPEMSDVSDLTMLELLAENGDINRGEICNLVHRFTRQEEKSNFIILALEGCNTKLLRQKAGEMGANAIMKVEHAQSKMRTKPSEFGADSTQTPSMKIAVKTKAVAINYEPPQGEAMPSTEKVLVMKKVEETGKASSEPKSSEKQGKAKTSETGQATVQKETAGETEKKEEAIKEEKKEEKKGVITGGKPEKESKVEEKKAPAQEEKKSATPEESSKYLELAAEKEKEIKSLEEEMASKKKEIKEINDELLKKKEAIKTLKKEMIQAKMKANKLKVMEEAKRKEEEMKAKIEERKLAKLKEQEEKEKKKKEEEAKKAEEKEKAKIEKKEVTKTPQEIAGKGKETKIDQSTVVEEEKESEAQQAVDPVVEAKSVIKKYKTQIFDCLRKSNASGSVMVTYLFKPSGELDALGFDPSMPDTAHKCIMQLLKKETFPASQKYYKAIFKYTLK